METSQNNMEETKIETKKSNAKEQAMPNEDRLDRRRFIKTLAAVGLGLAEAKHLLAKPEKQLEEKKPIKPFALVPQKKFGATNEKIPILVLGGSMRFNPKYDKILHRAYKEGINYIDTALVYANGESHRTIAPFIKQIGDRKKLWITSKVPVYGGKADTASFAKDLQTCLKQLDTHYLDLLFMHNVDEKKYLEKAYIEWGEKMKKEKKIRYFGFSCHGGNVAEVMELAAKTKGIDAIMFRYNFSRYGDKKLNRAIDACHKAGIGLIAMKTMDSVPDKLSSVTKFRSKKFSLPQAKLKAVWADDRIDSIVSHMDNTDILAENIAAAKSPIQLGMNEMMQLMRYAALTAPYSCQGCAEICSSKISARINIADSLRFLMYYECYHEPQKAIQLYNALQPEEVAIEGLDFRAAQKACPQGIDIGKRLAEAKGLLYRA